MGNHETAGIATMIVGLVLVIGAVRGTWKRIFKDVILDAPDQSSGGGQNAPAQVGPSSPTAPGPPFTCPQGTTAAPTSDGGFACMPTVGGGPVPGFGTTASPAMTNGGRPPVTVLA